MRISPRQRRLLIATAGIVVAAVAIMAPQLFEQRKLDIAIAPSPPTEHVDDCLKEKKDSIVSDSAEDLVTGLVAALQKGNQTALSTFATCDFEPADPRTLLARIIEDSRGADFDSVRIDPAVFDLSDAESKSRTRF